MNNGKWQVRWSPTLGDLEGKHQDVWGTEDYTDQERPTVFFGIYSFPDFEVLWKHKGVKEVLWCGSDITRFVEGYWLEDEGRVKIPPTALAPWLSRNCGHWVENTVEQDKLAEVGIHARVCPSFLGNVDDFEVSFKPGNKLYTSVSGDEFTLYGWDKIYGIALQLPEIEFHLYGSDTWNGRKLKNIFDHGRVPREQMNSEIKEMQGAIRLTTMDGFSEIVAKSLLMGQYPVSLIPYKYTLDLDEAWRITELTEPNLKGREHYRKIINRFPWNEKIR